MASHSKYLFAALIVVLAACAGRQQTVTPTASYDDDESVAQIKRTAENVAVTPAPPSSSEVVCREVRITGSHLPKERCATRARSRREAQEAREWLRSGGLDGSVSVVQ